MYRMKDFEPYQTLEAFQLGEGIPIEDQLLIVDNPNFDKLFHHLDITEPKRIKLPLRILSKCLRRLRVGLKYRKLTLNGVKADEWLSIRNCHGRLPSMDDVAAVAKQLNRELAGRLLVLGKSDLELGDELMSYFSNLDIALFGNNFNSADPRAHYLPMGRDFRGKETHSLPPSAKKDKLVYCNFSLNTHSVRPKVWEAIRSKPFVCSQHMGEYLDYSLSHQEFYSQLASSKFCIAPRGNAIETFRMWDCLCVGTIPIVVREALLYQDLEDLPILFLDSYEQFSDLTESGLEAVYTDMLSRDWNYEKLRLSYWLNRISDAAGELASS